MIQDELDVLDSSDHSEDCDAFEKHFFYVKAKFNEILHPVVEPLKSRHSSGNSSQHSAHTVNRSVQSGSSHSRTSHIKLPVIELCTFDGSICEWMSYKDTFEALIIKNTQVI